MSVTVSLNTYVPGLEGDTLVDADVVLENVAEGPPIFVHLYEEMLPSLSVPDPARLMVVTELYDLSEPALAVGR